MVDVAIVTGGTGSIGTATCRHLVEDGWTVVVADVVPLSEPMEGCRFFQLDAGSAESVSAVFDLAASLGTLRALIGAHGIIRETPLGSFDDDVVQAVLEVNLKGIARLCTAATSRISDRGAIVLLSSVTSTMGRAKGGYAYQAAKAGVESLTRSFAIGLAAREVRVNCVAPGYLSQPMRGGGVAIRARQGGDEAIKALTPFGRLVMPEEVAAVIAFLCSERASGISGVVLPVDGGQRAY